MDSQLTTYDCSKYDFQERKNLKRRLLSYYRKQRIPKLIKSDLRRFFTEMFVNVTNTCDVQLFRDFMFSYATENCSERFSLLYNNYFVNVFAENRNAIMTTFPYMFDKFPDFAATILNNTIYRRSNTPDIEIRTRIRVEATDPLIEDRQYLCPKSEELQCINTTYHETTSYQEFCHLYQFVYQISLEFELIFKIDENSRVYYIEIAAITNTETPSINSASSLSLEQDHVLFP